MQQHISVTRLLGRISQILFPTYGHCSECGFTWNLVERHITSYSSRRGCFPLCEGCWRKLTIDERMRHYRALWCRWIAKGMPRPEAEWNLIEAAVREGK